MTAASFHYQHQQEQHMTHTTIQNPQFRHQHPKSY